MKLIPRTKAIDTDDNIGRGMDFALVTLVFLGIGWALDRAFDTRPAFMIGCVVFAVVGQFVRMWYAYDASMRRHEADRLAERQAAPQARVELADLSYGPLEIPRGFAADAGTGADGAPADAAVPTGRAVPTDPVHDEGVSA